VRDGYLQCETEEDLGKEGRCGWKIAGRVAGARRSPAMLGSESLGVRRVNAYRRGKKNWFTFCSRTFRAWVNWLDGGGGDNFLENRFSFRC